MSDYLSLPSIHRRKKSMPNNHEGESRKKCPFLNTDCIGDACACFIQVTQTRVTSLGVAELVQTGMCSLPALCMIMSSPKSQEPQAIKLPQIFKQ
jgi:hypothetical protein